MDDAIRYCDTCGHRFVARAVHRFRDGRQLCRTCLKRDPDIQRSADVFRAHMRLLIPTLRRKPGRSPLRTR